MSDSLTTLPSIKIRSPSLPSSMSVRRLILWTTESFSNVFPLHTDSPVWRYTWLESYITGREHIIHVGNRHSPPSKVLYGVPQGSVLGPVLYVLYTSDVARLVEALGLGTHLYADDTQLYGHCSPANSFELASQVLRAIDSIHEWMSSNRLSLNTGKTQFIWLGTKHSLAKRETDRLFSLLLSLTELTSVRNLGFIIDQELNMKDHITKLCQLCYYQLRQIRTVRHSHHQPSKLWSMPSSALESISPTAFSMGQVPTSLTVSNQS